MAKQTAISASSATPSPSRPSIGSDDPTMTAPSPVRMSTKRIAAAAANTNAPARAAVSRARDVPLASQSSSSPRSSSPRTAPDPAISAQKPKMTGKKPKARHWT